MSRSRKLLFAGVPLVVLMVGVEGVTRCLFEDWKYRSHPVTYCDYLPFTTPPNIRYQLTRPEFSVEIAFDDNGFRGPSPTPVPLSRRSLYLGDSFTLGWGLPYAESYVYRIADGLKTRRTIFNAAYTAGHSPDTYYAYLVRHQKRLAIDEAIIFLYLENDLADVTENIWLATDDYGGPTRLSTRRMYINYLGEPLDLSLWSGPSSWPVIRHSLFLKKIFRRLGAVDQFHGEEIPPPDLEQAFKQLEQATQATVRFCKNNHIRLGYVLIPCVEEIRSESLQRFEQRVLALLASYEEVKVLNLSGRLGAGDYFPQDRHLKAQGSAIVAQAVLQEFYSKDSLATSEGSP